MSLREKFLLWWASKGAPNTPAIMLICEDCWQAAYSAGREAALEEAAKACDAYGQWCINRCTIDDLGQRAALPYEKCAAAIRALKEKK